jgi:hypothetical protein
MLQGQAAAVEAQLGQCAQQLAFVSVAQLQGYTPDQLLQYQQQRATSSALQLESYNSQVALVGEIAAVNAQLEQLPNVDANVEKAKQDFHSARAKAEGVNAEMARLHELLAAIAPPSQINQKKRAAPESDGQEGPTQKKRAPVSFKVSTTIAAASAPKSALEDSTSSSDDDGGSPFRSVAALQAECDQKLGNHKIFQQIEAEIDSGRPENTLRLLDAVINHYNANVHSGTSSSDAQALYSAIYILVLATKALYQMQLASKSPPNSADRKARRGSGVSHDSGDTYLTLCESVREFEGKYQKQVPFVKSLTLPGLFAGPLGPVNVEQVLTGNVPVLE